jgi:hypothetical protein
MDVRVEVTSRGFLCRSPSDIDTGRAAANVAKVWLGDELHFYYAVVTTPS